MGGGAWPFLVGGVICLVNSDNERDLNLLNRNQYLRISIFLLRGTILAFSVWKFEAMPLDVLGCTRATLMRSTSL